MASVTLYRCTVPHFQGDEFVAAGTMVPEGSPKYIADFFEAEEHTVDAPKKATKKDDA